MGHIGSLHTPGSSQGSSAAAAGSSGTVPGCNTLAACSSCIPVGSSGCCGY